MSGILSFVRFILYCMTEVFSLFLLYRDMKGRFGLYSVLVVVFDLGVSSFFLFFVFFVIMLYLEVIFIVRIRKVLFGRLVVC